MIENIKKVKKKIIGKDSKKKGKKVYVPFFMRVSVNFIDGCESTLIRPAFR